MASKTKVLSGRLPNGRFDLSNVKPTPVDDQIYSAGFVIAETVESRLQRLLNQKRSQPEESSSARKISRDAHPIWRLSNEYTRLLGSTPPRGLWYAVSTGQLSRQEATQMIEKAIKDKALIVGYELLMSGDPAIV